MKKVSALLVLVVFFSVSFVFCAYGEEAQSKQTYYDAKMDNTVIPTAVSNPASTTTQSLSVATIGTNGTIETIAAVVPPPPSVEKTTLENLQAAFNGESNANARYLAFAQKADEEGYGKVASLFRAAARAEQIHFERHSKVIKEMGGTPTAVMEAPVVKSTAENVEAAMKGEIYENTVMYPEFLAKAEKDNDKEAIDAFEDAEAAEGVHAKLYKEALENLQAWKSPGKNFYVCPVCGNVMENMKLKNCPICDTSRKQFVAVR